MEQTQQESKKKVKKSIAWQPITVEAGRILLVSLLQGAALAAGGKLIERSLRPRPSGEVVSINRKAL